MTRKVTRILCNYNIVDKESTKHLQRMLKEIRMIEDGYGQLYFSDDENEKKEFIDQVVDEQINRKLHKLYMYYEAKYGVEIMDSDWGESNNEFDEEWRINKTVDTNITSICEEIKCWEE